MVQLYYLVPVCVISMFKFIFINLSTLVTTTTTTILSFTPSLLQEKKNYYIQQMIGVLAAQSYLQVKNARQPIQVSKH